MHIHLNISELENRFREISITVIEAEIAKAEQRCMANAAFAELRNAYVKQHLANVKASLIEQAKSNLLESIRNSVKARIHIDSLEQIDVEQSRYHELFEESLADFE
jgi:hypothetical protein